MADALKLPWQGFFHWIWWGMKVWNQENELWTGGRLLQMMITRVLGLILGGSGRWNGGKVMWNEKKKAVYRGCEIWWSVEDEEENGDNRNDREWLFCFTTFDMRGFPYQQYPNDEDDNEKEKWWG